MEREPMTRILTYLATAALWLYVGAMRLIATVKRLYHDF